MYQDGADRLAELLSFNTNETAFATLDQTIQIQTAEQSSKLLDSALYLVLTIYRRYSTRVDSNRGEHHFSLASQANSISVGAKKDGSAFVSYPFRTLYSIIITTYKLTVSIFKLCGDVYGEFYTIEPVLEECLLFNPFIAFDYQLDNQPAVTLNAAVEYKPRTFNSTISSNVTAYYMPEKTIDRTCGKKGKNNMHVLVNCHSDAPNNRPFIEVIYSSSSSL